MTELHDASQDGSAERHEMDGLCAIFRSRADADLALEHLAQEYGIDPAFIYVEPVADENSSGIEASGGDHACATPSHNDRSDAPLHGAIQLNVSVEPENVQAIEAALFEVGATSIERF